MITQTFSMKVLPPTLNVLIASARASRFGDASVKKTWTALIALSVKQQRLTPMTGQVFVEYVWRVKNRQRDQDNITASQKYILDGLVKGGVLKDDNLSVICSPVLHHFVISNHDGFSIILRDAEAHTVREWMPLSYVPDIDITFLPDVVEKKNSATRKTVPPRSRHRKRTLTKKAVVRKNTRVTTRKTTNVIPA